MTSKLKDDNLKVFLKCKDCRTFIISPSFPIIKKHFEKCQQTARTSLNDDGLDKEWDFIDDKMDTVTFTHPYVLLRKLNDHHNKPLYSLNQTDMNELPLASEKTPSKSSLKALKKLIQVNRGTEYLIDNDDNHRQIIKTHKKVSTTSGRGVPKRKCDKCGQMFDKYYLEKHKKRFHSANSVPKVKPEHTYRCPYPKCVVNCKSVKLLKSHFILHLQKNPYVCTFPGCNVKSDKSCHLKKHMKLHLNPIPTCTKCGASYASRWQYKIHKCDANVEKQRCGAYKLVLINNLWRLKRSDYEPKKNEDKNSFQLGKSNSDSIKLLNKYITSTQLIDINSVIRSDPVFIQVCKDTPGFGELLLGRFYVSDNVITKKKIVSKCPTVFEAENGYNQHKKTNKHYNREASEEDPRNVLIGRPTCGKSFTSSDLLESHLNESHVAIKIFKCEEQNCGRYFAKAASSKIHFKRYHTDKFSVPCKLCGKVVFNATSLRRHMQTIHDITVKSLVRTKKVKVEKLIKNQCNSKLATHSPIRKISQRLKGNIVQVQSKEVKQRDLDCIRIKIEPELNIGPDFMNASDNFKFESWDHEKKY